MNHEWIYIPSRRFNINTAYLCKNCHEIDDIYSDCVDPKTIELINSHTWIFDTYKSQICTYSDYYGYETDCWIYKCKVCKIRGCTSNENLKKPTEISLNDSFLCHERIIKNIIE